MGGFTFGEGEDEGVVFSFLVVPHAMVGLGVFDSVYGLCVHCVWLFSWLIVVVKLLVWLVFLVFMVSTVVSLIGSWWWGEVLSFMNAVIVMAQVSWFVFIRWLICLSVTQWWVAPVSCSV